MIGCGGAIIFSALARLRGRSLVPSRACWRSLVLRNLGEMVGWRRWSAFRAGLVGVLLIIQPGLSDSAPVSLLAVVTVAALALRAGWASFQRSPSASVFVRCRRQ